MIHRSANLIRFKSRACSLFTLGRPHPPLILYSERSLPQLTVSMLYLFYVEISTEVCICLNSMCTLQWISQQLMMIKACFNSLDTLPGAYISVCSIKISQQ